MSAPDARETRAFANETKFLVSRETGAGIREWARRHLDADPHGSGASGDEYSISTIYFDSRAYDVFHRRGSFGRCKYRIRRYNGDAEVFLERKLRRPGLLAKRRTLVAAAELEVLEADAPAAWAGDWFHRRLLLRQLRPVCQLTYHRVARVSMSSSGPLRLTLDERLQVARAERPAFGNGLGLHLADEHMILELKYRADVPALFKQLVEEFKLQPQAASKYRIGIAAIDPAGTGRLPATPLTQGDAVSGLPCA